MKVLTSGRKTGRAGSAAGSARYKRWICVHMLPTLQNGKREQKKEKTAWAKQKKIERLEKKLIEVGYQNLPEKSLDLVHANKWLDPERLDELEQIRQQKIKEEQELPVQLNLFDTM